MEFESPMPGPATSACALDASDAASDVLVSQAEKEAAAALELLQLSRERLARATAAAPGAGRVGHTRRALQSLSVDEVSHLLAWLELDAIASPLRAAGVTGASLAQEVEGPFLTR